MIRLISVSGIDIVLDWKKRRKISYGFCSFPFIFRLGTSSAHLIKSCCFSISFFADEINGDKGAQQQQQQKEKLNRKEIVCNLIYLYTQENKKTKNNIGRIYKFFFIFLPLLLDVLNIKNKKKPARFSGSDWV